MNTTEEEHHPRGGISVPVYPETSRYPGILFPGMCVIEIENTILSQNMPCKLNSCNGFPSDQFYQIWGIILISSVLNYCTDAFLSTMQKIWIHSPMSLTNNL